MSEGRRRPDRRRAGDRPRATGRRGPKGRRPDPPGGRQSGRSGSGTPGGRQSGRSGSGTPGGNARPASRCRFSQQLIATQACVPRAALRVQDPKLRRPPRRPVPIPRYANLGPLPHDVPPEAYPGPPAQLQTERGDLGDRAGYGRGQIRRFEHKQLDLRSTCQRRQSVQSLAESGRGQTRAIARQRRQVQQQQVHRSVLKKHRRHRQRLLEGVRREDDQPFERNAPSRRLHRIAATREVQVGGYPAGRLSPGDCS